MSIFCCHQCDQMLDSDHIVAEEGPDRELWCSRCLEEYRADQAEIGRLYEEEQRLTALSLQNDPDRRYK